MEIDVTHMVEDSDLMPMLSGSIMELGDNAGTITWNDSKTYAKTYPLLKTDDALLEARDYFRQFGAWTNDEIQAWSEVDLQAMMCQDVAHAIREMEIAEDYDDYKRRVEAGTLSGNLYRGDNDRWYFYVGH